ncbi:hypothetical protein M2171_002565 [Bradyrhizobium japonicum USDA 38]|uniref:hypothetical protein n=1 Tax=Bradyrhizobium japonicum TaxID=375 RepID=UPI0004152E57|nr:hypothetical protein [Bradyrhizobium japonicum]MCS3893432.1 hypothetical protein [Bradyrhizobium japonicum USDA 38]MCS3945946.1 hypothetical protein [Bradyrhizobium japonicum]
MKKREPTETWQWVETWLRKLYGDKSWRSGGRSLFGFRAGELRPVLDFDLTEEQRVGVENIIADALRKRADDLMVQAQIAASIADEFDASCSDRRSAVRAAQIADFNDYVDFFTSECLKHINKEAA